MDGPLCRYSEHEPPHHKSLLIYCFSIDPMLSDILSEQVMPVQQPWPHFVQVNSTELFLSAVHECMDWWFASKYPGMPGEPTALVEKRTAT
jgi:hypothetical protein